MKRFSLHAVVDMASMVEGPKGKWVLFDDAWSRIAEAQGKVHDLRAQIGAAEAKLAAVQGELAQMTRERDQLKRTVALADALINKERGL